MFILRIERYVQLEPTLGQADVEHTAVDYSSSRGVVVCQQSISRMTLHLERLIRASGIIIGTGVKWVVHIKDRHVPLSSVTIGDVHVIYPTNMYWQVLHNDGGLYSDVL